MDVRAYLQSVAPISGRQFAWFRIVFGLYLTVHFAHLRPWARELFSSQGVLPDPALNPTHGILPNVLTWWDAPDVVTTFVTAMALLSLLFTFGVARRAAAVGLWYGWACLFNRNVLISNPSIAYVGLLLLLTTLVPATEPYRLMGRKAREDEFYFPSGVYHTAWILMAVGYTFSGVVKLMSPSWVDGTAFWHVVNNPLARDSWFRDITVSSPMWIFRGLTWGALALETLFLPLALWRVTRPVAWASMVGMHVGIIALVSFADLSAGMLMLHAFTFDPRWTAMVKAARSHVASLAQGTWRKSAVSSLGAERSGT
jgi:hypothetical protein